MPNTNLLPVTVQAIHVAHVAARAAAIGEKWNCPEGLNAKAVEAYTKGSLEIAVAYWRLASASSAGRTRAARYNEFADRAARDLDAKHREAVAA